jgi:hypothetical protein
MTGTEAADLNRAPADACELPGDIGLHRHENDAQEDRLRLAADASHRKSHPPKT